MEHGWALLVDLIALLAGSFLLGTLMERFRQSAVVGYILAGAILGPGLLGVVRDVGAVRALSELGVALVLFTIGLEFSLKSIRKLGLVTLVGGPVQILFTLGIAFLAAVGLKLDIKQAFAIGAVIALSSTAVVLKALKERGDLDAPHGKAALGILLVQDVALIPLVLIITLIAPEPGENFSWREVGPFVTQIALGVIGIVIVASLFLPRLLGSRAMARNRELPILMAVITCIGAAWGAQGAGFSPSLGAFIAGMVLAETAYADQIRADVAPLRALFATMFFSSIGMLADVRWLGQNLVAVLALTALIVLGKAIAAATSVRIFGLATIAAIAAGFTLAQVGELSFVLLQLGLERRVLEPWVAQLLTSSAVLSLALCPYLVGAAPAIGRTLAKILLPVRVFEKERAKEAAGAPRLRDHVVVVGFGEAGRSAALALRDGGGNPLVLEIDSRLVSAAQKIGFDARFGDATQQEILELAGIATAKGLVVAVSDHRSVRLVTAHARRLSPELPIVARARYHPFAEEIDAAGADRVVDEEALVGSRLADEMLLQLGMSWDEAGEGLLHPELRRDG